MLSHERTLARRNRRCRADRLMSADTIAGYTSFREEIWTQLGD